MGWRTRITINFPWGSLLAALLDGDPALLDGLIALAQPGATLEIRLNRGALAEAGYTPEAGVMRIAAGVAGMGFCAPAIGDARCRRDAASFQRPGPDGSPTGAIHADGLSPQRCRPDVRQTRGTCTLSNRGAVGLPRRDCRIGAMKVLLASIVVGLLALAFAGALVLLGALEPGARRERGATGREEQRLPAALAVHEQGARFPLRALHAPRARADGERPVSVRHPRLALPQDRDGFRYGCAGDAADRPRAGACRGIARPNDAPAAAAARHLAAAACRSSWSRTRSGAASARCRSARSLCSPSRLCRRPIRTPRRAFSTAASGSRSRRR